MSPGRHVGRARCLANGVTPTELGLAWIDPLGRQIVPSVEGVEARAGGACWEQDWDRTWLAFRIDDCDLTRTSRRDRLRSGQP